MVHLRTFKCKFSGLKLWLCKKSDKYEVWGGVVHRKEGRGPIACTVQQSTELNFSAAQCAAINVH